MRTTNALLPSKGFITQELLAPEQAHIAYLARVPLAPLGVELVALPNAPRRVLAETVYADADYPSVARSTMDGFAIRSRDVPGTLRVAGEVMMGRLWTDELPAHGALRIDTGGALPKGADAVIPIENVRTSGDWIEVDNAAQQGDYLTPVGSDMKNGEQILHCGRALGAAEVGVLATLGVIEVPVYRRPVFGVLSSGDELTDCSQQPAAGKIRDSNRYAVAAALDAMGVQAMHFPTVRDRADELASMLATALAQCDGAVLTGGSSVGEKDLTPRMIAALGSPGVVVHGLRVKPGKPTVLAAIGKKPVFGLPGNPVSALIILEAVVGPLIRRLTGNASVTPGIPARAVQAFSGRIGWTWFVPVCVQRDGPQYTARPLVIRSAFTSLLSRASGFVTLAENHGTTPVGELVEVMPFSSGGQW